MSLDFRKHHGDKRRPFPPWWVYISLVWLFTAMVLFLWVARSVEVVQP